jgi:hypothetical protein
VHRLEERIAYLEEELQVAFVRAELALAVPEVLTDVEKKRTPGRRAMRERRKRKRRRRRVGRDV